MTRKQHLQTQSERCSGAVQTHGREGGGGERKRDGTARNSGTGDEERLFDVGLSLGRSRYPERFRERITHDVASTVIITLINDRARVLHTTSADARTTRNVTRENPPRRPVRNVRKPRNYDINTHRRPPPPLGHEQYGVPPDLAVGKPTGWQE